MPLQRDLAHDAVELLVRVGVDEDLGGLPLRDAGDVALGDTGVEDHAGQVRDDHDDGAGVVHRSHHHHLADLGVEQGDHPVHRRADHGVGQVVLGAVDVGLGGGQGALDHRDGVRARLDAGLEVLDPLQGVVEGAAADVAGFIQSGLSFHRLAGEGQGLEEPGQPGLLRLKAEPLAVAAGLRCVERRRQVHVVELDDHVALADPVTLAVRQLLDAGGHLGGNLHHGQRLDPAGGRNGLDQRPPLGRVRADLRSGRFRREDVHQPLRRGTDHEDRADHEEDRHHAHNDQDDLQCQLLPATDPTPTGWGFAPGICRT
jgi:hypothetical protein